MVSDTGGYFSSQDGVPLYIIRNTGIGNMMEAWTLDPVNRLFRINTAGSVYIDGTYNGGGADFAEMLPAAGDMEAGDVMVIGLDGAVTRSTQAYQPSVVGVYSTQPGFVGGEGDDADLTGKVPVAVMGVVPVKVSTENGSIQPGDLLASASIPGHAMRCVGAEPCFGRTIGKALAGLEQGDGVIVRCWCCFNSEANDDTKTLFIALIIIQILLATATALAQTSANYNLEWHVIASGSGSSNSAGYRVNGAISQPVGQISGSRSFQVCAGFWNCGNLSTANTNVYLPAILKNN